MISITSVSLLRLSSANNSWYVTGVEVLAADGSICWPMQDDCGGSMVLQLPEMV